MLMIRLRRQGAKKRPFFRLVVVESHTARDGRAIEVVGHYNPTAQPEGLTLKRERLEYWLGCGAQPSDTVRTLLARHRNAPDSAEGAAADAAGAPAAGS
jgi:small subunit ribosomal protein S16